MYRQFVVWRPPTGEEKSWHDELRNRLDRVIGELRPDRSTAMPRRTSPGSKFGTTTRLSCHYR